MRAVLIAVLVAFAATGCTARYQVNNLAGGSATRLERSANVYVSVPSDGAYGGTQYAGSGQTVAQSVANAFAPYSAQVAVASERVSPEEAMSAAQAAKARYLVAPAIVHWEQRATEWSGRPSRMTIRISIFDVATGNQLTATSIEGRSRIVSFISTSPESLLRDPLAQYVGTLFQ